MSKGLKIFLVIFGMLMVGNLAFLDWQLFLGGGEKWEVGREVRVRSEGENKQGVREEERVATDSCGLVCQETIVEKIKEELAKISLPAGQSSVSPTALPKTPASNGKPKVVFVPLVTSGSAASLSWTDIVPSEFYFDLENYPNAKEVRFEAYILSSNNDLGYARLYDVTNKRGVDFSDIQTISSTFTRVESSGMTIWRGNNKYTLQLRSVNGTQVQLKDGKIKIIFD